MRLRNYVLNERNTMINEGATAISVEIKTKSKKMFEKKLDRLKELYLDKQKRIKYSKEADSIRKSLQKLGKSI